MARKTKVTTGDVDALNALLLSEFNFTLRNPPVDPETGARLPVPAAALAVIVKYIVSSGIRPTHDSPLGRDIEDLMKALPFASLDESSPTPSPRTAQ